MPTSSQLPTSQDSTAMGKGKGKAAKRAEKSAKKVAKNTAKRAAREAAGTLPKPRSADDGPRPMKKPKTRKPLPTGINVNDLPELPTPAAKATEALKHVKWTALFKKHLGILESHVKALDRVMQSLKSFMANLEPEERELWECGEKGNWKHICGLMDRARETVVTGRMAATGLIPEHSLRDKKGLGIRGFTFEPLLPKIEQRARELGKDPNASPTMANVLGNTGHDVNSKMEDSSSSSSDSDSSSGSGDESESDSDIDSEKSTSTEGSSPEKVEDNQYFVIDTKPTPVDLNGNVAEPKKKSRKRANPEEEAESPTKAKKSKTNQQIIVPQTTEPETSAREASPVKDDELAKGADTKADKKSKKRRAHDEESEGKKLRKTKKDKSVAVASETVEQPTPTVDFAAIQAQLQAEVDEGIKAKEAEQLQSVEKKDKKRRRVSDGEEKVGKKAKKSKGETEDKEKKEKKEKKRKAEEEVVVEVVEKKKKRKEA